MDYHQCEDSGRDMSLKNSLWYFEFILVVGMVGNAINIVVFRHERMKSYINMIFYWLAVCDFLLLLQIAVFSLLYGTESATNLASGLFTPSVHDLKIHRGIPREWYNLMDLSFYLSYILLSLHTSTVLLNIAIALCLYEAIVRPQRFKVWCSTRSIGQIATHAYVIGFVLWIPHLFPFPQVILLENGLYPGPSVELVIPSRRHMGTTFLLAGIECYSLLVVLLVICIKLIIGIVKTRRERRGLISNPLDAGIEGEGSVDQFTKEITNLILPIAQIFIFLITEISIAIIPTLLFMYNVLPILDGLQMDVFHCYIYSHFFLNGFVASTTVLVSSSYLIFFYLTSAHYRLTLEILFRSGYSRLKRTLKLGSYRELRLIRGAGQ